MPRDAALTIRIPEALLAAAIRAARAEEITPAEFVRAALAERLAEIDPGGARDPVGQIRRALRRQFREAGDWLDLQRRLRAEGFVLRELGDELWLFSWPVERRLVPLARIGPAREDLTLHFRAPFPAHGGRGAAATGGPEGGVRGARRRGRAFTVKSLAKSLIPLEFQISVNPVERTSRRCDAAPGQCRAG